MGCRACSRSRAGRVVRLRGSIDGRVLPAVVPEPAAATRSRRVLRPRRRARAAGFRACRRCRPDEDAAAIRGSTRSAARACISPSVDGHPSLATLAERGSAAVRITSSATSSAWSACRLARYAEAMPAEQSQTRPPATAATSPRRWWTPATDRAAGSTNARSRSSACRRRRIETAAPARPSASRIVGSPLGRLLVAATARGVCAVTLGDSDATLRSELAREFNAATILEDDGVAGEVDAGNPDAPRAIARPKPRAPWSCRSTSRPRRFNGRCGRRWRRSRTAKRGPTATSPSPSASRRPFAPSRGPARPTPSRSRSRVTESCRRRRWRGGYRWGAQRKRALPGARGAGKAR